MTPHPRPLLLLALAALTGCASVQPVQLVEARLAYEKSAQGGLTTRLTPTELYEARKSLDGAIHEFDRSGDTQQVRDLAYVAQRKVELADVRARTEEDRLRIAAAVKATTAVREATVKSTQEALSVTRNLLNEETRAHQASKQELDAEKQARSTAESRLAAAMKDLATVARVKEEARGVVITLSGSVLFASGQDALLLTAESALDQVARALEDQGPDKYMVVEGHTDSTGPAWLNDQLSLRRAMTVREYLVSRGVPSGRISARGLGSSHPLVDNLTAENRANNRRVEIIIESRNPPVSWNSAD